MRQITDIEELIEGFHLSMAIAPSQPAIPNFNC